jgi:uncharacterized protein (TIGR03435 family)
MNHRLTGPILAILTTCRLMAQNVPPEFDVASVKPNQANDGHTSVDRNGGVLRMGNVTLKYCITFAYSVTDSQVSGPGWIDSEKYDIVAKEPFGASTGQQPLMLRALLADRFKLAFHRETKELSVYGLVIAKNGPKIKNDPPGGTGDGSRSSSPGHLTSTGTTMAQLATFLAGPRAALGRPVVDKTGLNGVFSFTLDWTPDSLGGETGGMSQKEAKQAPALLTAVQEQLGLRLEVQKAPVEILIVDRAEKVPTAN